MHLHNINPINQMQNNHQKYIDLENIKIAMTQ